MWSSLPTSVPANNSLSWIRIKYYYSSPFLAYYDSILNQFSDIVNSIIYPAWSVARWKIATSIEQILNGAFTSASNWTCDAYWAIASNKASYTNTAVSGIRQTNTFTANKRYLLSFDILDCASSANFFFLNTDYTVLFQSPYNIMLSLPNGSYKYVVSIAATTTRIRIIGDPSGNSFSITNISMKPII